MSLSDHFFKGKCCVCSIRYFLSWFFFLSSIGVTIAILLINPKHIDYGNVPLTVRVLFFITIGRYNAGYYFVWMINLLMAVMYHIEVVLSALSHYGVVACYIVSWIGR